MGDGDTSKPLVLLDVDGVLNAWPHRGDEVWAETWAGFRVLVAEETLEALRLVFKAAKDVMWCTAWRDQANVQPMAFLRKHRVTTKNFLFVITDGERFPSFTARWKLEEVARNHRVQRALAEGREVIWIEDFGFGSGLEHITLSEVMSLGITPIDTVKEDRDEGTYGRLERGDLLGTIIPITDDDEVLAMERLP